MSKNSAAIVEDVLSDGSVAINVEYYDGEGFPVLTVGCITKSDAEFLVESLNNAAWVKVDCFETLGNN